MSRTDQGDWPFDQPRNCATVTVWRILRGEDPVTYVAHSKDDHSWMFLNTGTGGSFDMRDAALVALESLLKLDPTLREIADLPPGWNARRNAVGRPWVREQDSELVDD